MTPSQPVRGRVALVTGGASGIGKAIALALAGAGVDVAIGSRTAGASSCGEELAALGVKPWCARLDVTSADSVQGFYTAAVSRFGRIDILVNSAGVIFEEPMSGHRDDIWHQVIDVNLNGTYRTIRLCLPGMIERRWGRIINITSTAASVGCPTFSAYCASKSGVLGLTRCVALEGAAFGVTCNAISPGWVETGLAESAIKRYARAEGKSAAEYREQIRQGNPQKRIVQAGEVGALAEFLCRDAALGITGQDIILSAGAAW